MNAHSRLSGLAAELRDGTLNPEGRERLALMIERVASGDDPAAALGVARVPGQRKVQTEAAIAERDHELREAATRFYPGQSASEQASRLYRDLLNYRAAAWDRERTYEACPQRHSGRVQEYLWRALKCRDRMLSWSTLRRILAVS